MTDGGSRLPCCRARTDHAEYREAYALFDKKGTGQVPRESLGELLRSLGQNPTQADVAHLESEVGQSCESLPPFAARLSPSHQCRTRQIRRLTRTVDYETFLRILNRPDGWKPAGTAGKPSPP